MARITRVAKARKDQGNCRRAGCHTAIKKGDAYYWFTNLIGITSIRKVFCNDHYPRPSETTTSDKLSTLYGIREGLIDSIPTLTALSDIQESLETAASEAHDVASEYEDSLSNMPEGLQEGSVGEGIQEKADAINQWADELESAASEIEDMGEDEDSDPPEPDTECANCHKPPAGHDLSVFPDAECIVFSDPGVIESARDRASDAVGSLEV